MNGDEARGFFARLKALYPAWSPDEILYELWREEVRDLPYAECTAALRDYSKTNPFAPRPAELRHLVTAKRYPPRTTVWHHVERYLWMRETTDYSRLHEIPEIIRVAIANTNINGDTRADRDMILEEFDRLVLSEWQPGRSAEPPVEGEPQR